MVCLDGVFDVYARVDTATLIFNLLFIAPRGLLSMAQMYREVAHAQEQAMQVYRSFLDRLTTTMLIANIACGALIGAGALLCWVAGSAEYWPQIWMFGATIASLVCLVGIFCCTAVLTSRGTTRLIVPLYALQLLFHAVGSFALGILGAPQLIPLVLWFSTAGGYLVFAWYAEAGRR